VQHRGRIRSVLAAAAGLAAGLALAHAVRSEGCVDEGSLRLARAAQGVLLSWSGSLERDETWTVRRGDLSALRGGARDDVAIATELTTPALTDEDSTASAAFYDIACETRSCNGAPHLCGRRYDEVTYATTHNSMSSAEDGWILPNQETDVPHQLEAGVRALMLDVHSWLGDTYLCHGTCLGGFQRLADGLAEIRAFLDAHPAEVVTLVFESYVPVEDVEAAFVESGLIALVHEQAPGEPWPTLGEMIDAGRRVVVLSDRDGGARPWHHGLWTFAWETDWAAQAPEDLTCEPNRGTPGNDLFILNHFLTDPTARRDLAELVNHDPFLGDRARACQTAFGHVPNFVTVDFHEIGDLLPVVDALNAP
jgi:hypothetical protein